MHTPTLCFQLLVGGHAVVGTEWNYAEHLTECGKIYLIRSGTGWMRHGGVEYQLRPGRLYLIPEAVLHSCGCPHEMAVDYVHFTGMDDVGTNVFRRIPVVYECAQTADTPVAGLMDALIAVNTSTARLRCRLAASGMLQTLLSLFVTDEPQPDSDARSRLLPVFLYIDQNLGDHISVTMLADRVGLDRTHFTRLFTKLYGMAPTAFIHQRRLSRAKLLLRSTDASIGAIADELGYTDGSHLWREFKRSTGLAPSEYRAADGPNTP